MDLPTQTPIILTFQQSAALLSALATVARIDPYVQLWPGGDNDSVLVSLYSNRLDQDDDDLSLDFWISSDGEFSEWSEADEMAVPAQQFLVTLSRWTADWVS